MPQPKKAPGPRPSDANTIADPTLPLTNSGSTGFSNGPTGGGNNGYTNNPSNLPPPQTGGGVPPIQSGVSNSSVSVTYPAGGALVMSFETFIPLFLAFAFWFVSLYLWNESARFQKWLIKDEKDAPDSQSGFGAIATWTIIIVLSTFLLWLGTHPPIPEDGPSPLFFLFSILQSPHSYVTVIFMLGVVPAAIAFCKFALAIPLAQTATNRPDATNSISRSPMTAVFGAIIGVINLAGSSVTLWIWLSAVPK